MFSLEQLFGKGDRLIDLLEASAEEVRISVQSLIKLLRTQSRQAPAEPVAHRQRYEGHRDLGGPDVLRGPEKRRQHLRAEDFDDQDRGAVEGGHKIEESSDTGSEDGGCDRIGDGGCFGHAERLSAARPGRKSQFNQGWPGKPRTAHSVLPTAAQTQRFPGENLWRAMEKDRGVHWSIWWSPT